MKFRFALGYIFIVSLTLLLSACNFTLAEDITPPPNYVSPTPAPTLGPLHPAQAPNIENGAVIYAEKCAPCHGDTGLGDGEQGIQLGVTVPAFGLSEVARPASLAQWYTVVTQGNMERFMPPFASLSDQERWDVVAYAMTLHTSQENIEFGKELFETNCSNCSTDFFKDPSKMSALSEVELARIIKQGNEAVPPFGATLSDDEVWAVAAYLRTLSFDTAPVVSAPVSTAMPEAFAGTPSVEGSQMSTLATARVGTVSGTIENNTGADLPSDLKVTLRGYDHSADPSVGPQEVLTLEGTLTADNTFVFENVEIALNRIFVAELRFDGMDLKSGFAIVEEGNTSLSLPPIMIYPKTEDTSALVIDEARIFLEYGTDHVQVFHVYSFRNPRDEIILVKLNKNKEIPFIRSPEGSSGFGYEPLQDSEPFVQTETGFAIPPSEKSYGLLAFASLPKAKELEFSQEFVVPIPTVTVFLPEGVTAEGPQITDLGIQAIENFNFQVYELTDVSAGDRVAFTVSGSPRQATSESAPQAANANRKLLIGAGVLGLALLLAGGWLYLREHNTTDENGADVEDIVFETSEDVMDAIIALDDLRRADKISGGAYHKRRAELKEILKGLL
ncbi:MAG TPA: c-type cytochrome [Anaerolineales bacterium]|nr:c-type cytochrome [Anaerolineales bacterium]